jgi:hypothetical protein
MSQLGHGEPRPAELLEEPHPESRHDAGQQQPNRILRREDGGEELGGTQRMREENRHRCRQERSQQGRDRVPARAHAPAEQPGAQLPVAGLFPGEAGQHETGDR